VNAPARKWTVTGPHGVVSELRDMFGPWRQELLRQHVYTPAEMSQLAAEKENGWECSWSAPPEALAGPATFVARLEDGELVAGVELWRQDRDRYWFLEGLIRNLDPAFKSAGFDIVNAALQWVERRIDESESESGYGVRVHAMSREATAVKFWSRYLDRRQDFGDAFIKTADYRFPALGWIIRAGARAGGPGPGIGG
jgi:hypothetical protein